MLGCGHGQQRAGLSCRRTGKGCCLLRGVLGFHTGAVNCRPWWCSCKEERVTLAALWVRWLPGCPGSFFPVTELPSAL